MRIAAEAMRRGKEKREREGDGLLQNAEEGGEREGESVDINARERRESEPTREPLPSKDVQIHNGGVHLYSDPHKEVDPLSQHYNFGQIIISDY